MALFSVSTRLDVTDGAVGFGGAGVVGVGAAAAAVGFAAAGTVGVGAASTVEVGAGGRVVVVGVGALGATGPQPTTTSSNTPRQQHRSRTV